MQQSARHELRSHLSRRYRSIFYGPRIVRCASRNQVLFAYTILPYATLLFCCRYAWMMRMMAHGVYLHDRDSGGRRETAYKGCIA